MRIKAALVLLLLFAFGAGFSWAAAHEDQRPSYYYGSAPYEYGFPGGAPIRYPEYMPREFGILPEREQETWGPEPEYRVQDLPGFIPYEYARGRYSERNIALPPPRNETQAAPPIHSVHPGTVDTDGFIPYEYARQRYSAPSNRQ